MKRILLTLILLVGLCSSVSAQNLNTELDIAESRQSIVVADFAEVADGDRFHRGVIVAAHELVKRGEMKRVDLIRLRVAMISPAFRGHAKDLAVIQIASSGVAADEITFDDNGQIDEAAIDWEGFSAFLEKFIPLLLMLLKAFGLGI